MDATPALIQSQASRSRAGRHILLLEFDLFATVGGGQSAYRRLIALRPDDHFYYFRQREGADPALPANVTAIPFEQIWRGRGAWIQETPDAARPAKGKPRPADSSNLLSAYATCRNFALSVAAHSTRRDFDVVDTPDYAFHGLFIRQALASQGIRIGAVALSLHGTLSDAFAGGWPQGGRDMRQLAELRVAERLQFRAVDARYALSSAYAAQWQRRAPLEINALDPLCLAGSGRPALAAPRAGAPDLAFVGRREKWKGPDLFLDIAWCIPDDQYRRLKLIGPDGPNRLGVGSADTLAAMARQRKLDVEILGGLPQVEVQALLRERTLLLLPSRHDTFNLVALEALTQGCPALVSDRTGFAHWLRGRLPELDWMVVPIDCSRTAAAHVSELLRDYDARRAALVEALNRAALRPDLASIQAIYDPAPSLDLEARQTVIDLAARYDLLERATRGAGLVASARRAAAHIKPLARSVAPLVPAPLRRVARNLGKHALLLARTRSLSGLHGALKEDIRARFRNATGLSPRTIQQIIRARRLPRLRKDMVRLPETSTKDLRAKIALLSTAASNFLVDRVRLYRELARLERRAGHELIAATYQMRIMRWLGEDRYGDLPFVAATFRAAGFRHEAAAVEAMFGGDPADRDARSAALMQDAYQRNRHKPELPLAVLQDPRSPESSGVARATVIVSLYNAASKLPTLLDNLAQQTLARAGQLEVVLVDSNSPTDERAALEAWRSSRGATLPVVYARSAERETIQAAWNRGIRLSRAPYLAFLGADEGLHPDALRQLAAALDHERRVDWAMADSLVTSVDRDGVFDADVMPYNRTGYRQDLVLLETCYLSWVGGLYRRSIHDRFGFYDESFRAAGDTEFKNRIMPHIRSVHVPGMLGVFNNYPEERTTQHPRAEIEDLRAWYLWRTPAGMDYAFGRRPVEEALTLLRDCFAYRKSFTGHISTDFDLAASLARHIEKRPDAPGSAADMLRASIDALARMRQVELLPSTAGGRMSAARHTWSVVRDFRQNKAASHAALFGLPEKPFHEVFNDNRYEQHWWSWSG
jgi:glycosyltransferase involved in cell wall biosynthesis